MKKTHSAFTLIELLLVVAIMAIVSYATIPGYLTSQSKQKLTNNAKDILRILNEARNRSIAGLALEGEDENSNSTIEPQETILPHAFGVYFQKDADFRNGNSATSRAVLFADQNGNWEFDYNSEDVKIEEIEFPYISKIYDLQVMEETNTGGTKYNPTEAIVFFRVPMGDIALRMNNGTWSEVETMPDLSWLRVDLGMWQMANLDGEIEDRAYIRSLVSHSVSDYSYMCSSIEAYNAETVACSLK